MKKVFVYKMTGCTLGTDETYLHVGETPLDAGTLDETVTDHAMSYGDQEGEWYSEGDEDSPVDQPAIWLEEEVTTLKGLEVVYDYIVAGSQTLEDLASELEKEGMVWQS